MLNKIVILISFFSLAYSQTSGCAVIYADNYDIDASGCENGSLDCCEFSCVLEYQFGSEQSMFSNEVS